MDDEPKRLLLECVNHSISILNRSSGTNEATVTGLVFPDMTAFDDIMNNRFSLLDLDKQKIIMKIIVNVIFFSDAINCLRVIFHIEKNFNLNSCGAYVLKKKFSQKKI